MSSPALRFSLLLAVSALLIFPPHQRVLAQQGVEISPDQLESALAKVDDTASLLQLVGQLREAGETAKEALVWQRLVQLRPHIGGYRYEMAAAYAQQDMKSEAYTALLELQSRGFAFAPEDDERFRPVQDTRVWSHVIEGLRRNRDGFGEGRILHTLPPEDLLIESLAFDESRGRLLVGSVREGKVYVVGDDGSLTTLVEANSENGMWGVFGIAVDAPRGVLWVASTAVPHFRGYNAERDLGKAGIFKFQLSNGSFIKQFLSPAAPGQTYVISDITVARDGAVYALDPANSAIYQVREDAFRRLLHAPHLGGVRALAVSDDSRTLYFSDIERGIFGLDLASSAPFDVRVPANLTLAGIEAMSYWNGHLLVLQNGLPPNRIMRLRLAAGGQAVGAGHPLEANRSELPLPVGTAVAPDGRMYVIGNSQREHYDRFGLPRNRDRLQGARLFELRADFAMEREEPAAPTMIR